MTHIRKVSPFSWQSITSQAPDRWDKSSRVSRGAGERQEGETGRVSLPRLARTCRQMGLAIRLSGRERTGRELGTTNCSRSLANLSGTAEETREEVREGRTWRERGQFR